ncbi:hypothetical protein [Nostoc linckia]|uniref:hypothetical protein n=1 Tax=Nostoc linckia TaxID=92942 RepID=UPI001F556DC3|nr:hypothetical protein [Nostoc linckia]
MPKVSARDWGAEGQGRVRTPFIDFGTPFIVLGTPFIDLGTPFIVLGTPFIVLGTPFIDFGTPFIVLGTPFIDFGTPFIVLGTPFIDFGTPFIVLIVPCPMPNAPFPRFNVCQLLLILPPPVFHLELVTRENTPPKQICGDFTREQFASHLLSSIRELLSETQLCLLFG